MSKIRFGGRERGSGRNSCLSLEKEKFQGVGGNL
jgi:hypothetical protein